VAAERGRLVVPESWERPSGSTVELQFVRFKSTAAKPGAPIVYLAGGPGGSGVAAARGARFPVFMALREVADVIALDQRGTGSATPSLLCAEPWTYPVETAGVPAEILESMRAHARRCAAELARAGIDLTAYHTNSSADDLDALRRALGVERITLWGISYGTHLALATLRRHPTRIERAILAGVEGPDHTLKLPRTIDAHVRHIDSLARLDSALTRIVPDFAGMIRRVLERVERTPAQATVTDPRTQRPVTVVVSRFDLQRITATGIGDAQAIRQLPAFYDQMSRGDFSVMARRLLQERSNVRLSAMPFAMDCASGASPERLAQVRQEARETLLGGWIDFPFLDICDTWPHRDLGADFRSPLRTAVPTLFISGTLDGRTPPSNAEEVRRGFSHSAHLIIEGAAHSDDLIVSSPKIRDVMIEFLRDRPLSTTTITVPVRFTVPKDSVIGRGSAACRGKDEDFRRVVLDLEARQQNVGTAVAVLADGKLVFSGAFGLADREAKRPVTPATRFGIASITKAFTGVALLALHQQGRIDLDAPIEQYVPDFPKHPEGEITLRHLASHLGGIRHWGRERNAALYARHLDDVRDILPLFRDSAFAQPPGKGYHYSSYGYNLLAMAIQAAAGMPFTRYVEEAVIRPLGIAATAFDDPRRRALSDAARYSWYDLERFAEVDHPVRVPDWDYSHNMGGGNMVSTAEELTRFGRAVRAPGLLSEAALRLLHNRPTIGGVESGMSFGWFVRNTGPRRLAINGSNAGLQAGLVVYLDRDLAVAVLTNTWGKGSRSGEFASDAPDGLLGKLSAVCG